jgi:DNA repair protein RadA/Sms
VVNGVDPSRVAMIIAVLERRAGLRQLGEHDVYVSTVGGVRLIEPAADLAIAVAIASAMRDRAVPPDLAAVGEISLAGEVRPVTSAKQRGSEARRLGYRALLDNELGSVRAAVERAMMAATGPRERELDAAF